MVNKPGLEAVSCIDAEKIDIRGTLSAGKNVTIDINVIFIGDVILGDNVTVGPFTIIENARIGNDVTIKEYTSIEDATVHAGCRIGPYARIRPGTVLGEGTHIGNFVEVKNANIGSNSKINHHSFIGDATLGESVILGAGTITCNFTGHVHASTTIHDGAFVGSGVQIVAPCTIGKGAFVAAGSVITKDVPAEKLAICRTRELVIKELPG